MKFKVKKLREDAKLPSYAHEGDAGMDLYSCEDYELRPGQKHTFKLGFAAAFESGYVALVWDKSGLAAKHGLTVLAGVIDHGYRGEYGVVLLNTSDEVYHIKKGDKVAQLLLQPVISGEIEETDDLEDSARGQGGFGSTGK